MWPTSATVSHCDAGSRSSSMRPAMEAGLPQRVAVVHDWLSTYTGAERVLEQILQCVSSADVFALCDFLPADQRAFLGERSVRTSFLQRLPLARKIFRHYLPLMPLAVEQFDFSGYDAVVSSSWAFAKGVITSPDQLHLSYIHTPIRYAWELQHEYLDRSGLGAGLRAAIVRATLHRLRLWDVATARRADVLVANSHYVARRIAKCYGRKARVIYPPVDVDQFSLCTEKENYYLAASRLVPYKRVDLVVEAFSRTPHRKLAVIGDGPGMRRLKRLAGPNIELLGYQPASVLREYMQKARAFVFAGEEDFGIMPVEAQACGTPVIAFGKGGATETVIPGETGEWFEVQTADSLLAAIDRFESVGGFDPYRVRANAENFGIDVFRQRFTQLLARAWTRSRSKPGLRPAQQLSIARRLH